MDGVQEVTGSGNLPDNVRAGGQVAVEHGQAGVADEIGETHFGGFVCGIRELMRKGVSNANGCGEAAREVVEIVVAAQGKHSKNR